MMQRLLRRFSTFAPSRRWPPPPEPNPPPPPSQGPPLPPPNPPPRPPSTEKPQLTSFLEWGEERRAGAFSSPEALKPHIVHINTKPNNTFLNISDADGRTKFSSSIGSLHLDKGTKMPRFFNEPVAEQGAREAVKMGIKSVVIRIKGGIHIKKKMDALASFRNGVRSGGRDLCQILAIEDCTRLAHNGCRLKKRRRV